MKKRRTKVKFERLIRQLEGCLLRLGMATDEFTKLDSWSEDQVAELLNSVAVFVNKVGESIVEAKE